MAVTVSKPVSVGPNAVLLRWSSDLDNPTFRVSRNGRELYRTTQTSGFFAVEPSAAYLIEISDDVSERLTVAVAPRARLEFPSVSGAAQYRVERDVSGWTPLALQDENAGDNVQRFITPPLADGQDHDFRVVAIGADGNESTAGTATVTMRRHPDPPSVAVAAEYNGTLMASFATISEI